MARLFSAVLVVCVLAAVSLIALAADPPPRDEAVLNHLSETAAWYQRVVAAGQARAEAGEVLYRQSVGRASRQALDLGFEFSRAEAERAVAAPAAPPAGPATGPTTAPATGPTTGPTTAPATPAGRSRRLQVIAAAAVERALRLQAELEAVDREMAAAPRPADPALSPRRDRLASELNLATVRRDVLQRLLGFREGGDEGAEGTLLDKIEAIQRSIPAAPGQGDAAAAAVAGAAAGAAAAPASVASEPAGVIGLVSEMFRLSRRMRELRDLAEEAAALRQAANKLRAPLRTELMAAVRRADALAPMEGEAGPEGNRDGSAGGAPDAEGQRRELDALAAQFRRLSGAAVPLSRQSVLLDQARTSLLDWRSLLGRQYYAVLRALLVRLAITGAIVGALFFVSVLWRRATFRYVHDTRRRRQFMLLRRVTVGATLVVIAIFSFVTEFGSLATFAGILTAGIAVSLQTLILSGVAYFFFVGRYGVRVGDRVTVAGVTGEVLDTGLLRLHLMELGGNRRMEPTGRIVVFSNSVLFQPSGFFKQAPGADYLWHELSLTLAPDSDHRLVEKRLLAAVESVFAGYRDAIDRQHAAAVRTGAAPATAPRPEGRLRFVDAGLEFTLRYPVENRNASEIEDRVTRKLLAAIDEEPRLRLVPSGTPRIQAGKDGNGQ